MLSENQLIILNDKYRDLMSECKPLLQKGDAPYLREALHLAVLGTELRQTPFGEPAIYGGLDLAGILVREMALGKIPVAAALLLEPYIAGALKESEIRSRFGHQVVTILEGVRQISQLKTGKASIHTENFIRLLVGISKDIRVILLKLAESLYFLERHEQLPATLCTAKARESYYLYAPLAHRLGLYRIKTALEDLSMRILFPEEYHEIASKLAETTKARNEVIKRVIYPIKKELIRHGFEFEIKGRPKSVHSIRTKMKKQQVPFEEVYDILAIRIILNGIRENEKADCWKVYSIVTDIYPPNPARLRDWISTPKRSGYEALHTTVQTPVGNWVEVQIRSRRMDDNAEKGEVAHWRYKEDKISGEPEEWLNHLRELLDGSASSALGDDEAGRIDAVDPHIFAFTPQGDLKQLPPGSTVLDFAFNVHSDLGLRCTGGRVNGKNTPIRHILQNGDEVEIHTAKNQKPTKDWLQFVVSVKARQHIRKALRETEMKEAEAGREMLLRKLKNWKIPPSDDTLDKAVRLLKFKTHSDLFYAVATGELAPLAVKEILLRTFPENMPEPGSKTEKPPTRKDEKQEDCIYINRNLNNINFTLASCCQPVSGDPVFGFVTVSRGISVHRVNCPNAKDLQKRYNYRVVTVKWRDQEGAATLRASVRIHGIDQPGILNTISEVMAKELETDVRSVSIDSDKGVFRGTLKIVINDELHLERVIHRLGKIPGVLRVSRMD